MELAISSQAVEMLHKMYDRVKDNERGTIAAQIEFNIKTGAIERIAPLIGNGRPMRLRIKTADGFEDLCDYYFKNSVPDESGKDTLNVLPADVEYRI